MGVPTKWSSTGKEDTGDVGLRVVGEGMGRGNGESITANAMIMTRIPQMSLKHISTQRSFHIAEVRMYPHA